MDYAPGASLPFQGPRLPHPEVTSSSRSLFGSAEAQEAVAEGEVAEDGQVEIADSISTGVSQLSSQACFSW